MQEPINRPINFLRSIHHVYWLFVIIFTLIIGGSSFLVWKSAQHFSQLNQKISSLSSSIDVLEGNLASSTVKLENSITQTHTDLSLELDKEKQKAGEIENLLGTYKQENDQITGTVTDLQKLSSIDPELLQKYSKVFFLNEHYAPARLSEIPDTYEYHESKFSKINTQVWPYLEKMLKASISDGQEIYVYSAYRSFEEQNALKNLYAVTYGVGTANQFSADQGYSEHQLGTAIDLITTGLGGELDGFENTEASTWLLANAHKYGFTLSYPENNEYYMYEPWHWRFVGFKLATYLHNNNKYFYDLEQREIDEYLINLFE